MTADPKFDLNVKMTASDMKVMDVNATTKIVAYKLDQKGTFMGMPFPPTVYASTVWVNQAAPGRWRSIRNPRLPRRHQRNSGRPT
jgi:hypothetical protein